MKKLAKLILVTIPALAVVAAVGMTTIGCGDDTGTTGGDMAVQMDMVTPPTPTRDMAKND
jgi:hypothetical protein